uniref:Mitochondrial inner membrane protein OXA1L n=1 Tax=Heligmosomoides polygyrus TaxID=6339 RepID=A0A183GF86_HELPZ
LQLGMEGEGWIRATLKSVFLINHCQICQPTLHGAGLGWPYVFIASGVVLRIASSPLHIFAEKLFARRLHAQSFFTEGILKKLSEHYKVEVVPNATKTRLELKTKDPKIISHSEKLVISRRESSSLPSAIAPLFQYASDCYFTQGLQLGMEALHGAGLGWPYVFIASGVVLRIASSPLHIFAEKLFARRLHAQSFFTEGILKKLSEHYKVEVVPNATKTRLELKTKDPKIISHSEKLLAETIPQYMAEHGLQATRIQNLKMCTIPLWIFSSFAVRNVISSDFHPSIAGGLWVPDLLVPDPYFILPIAVGVFGFLNLYSQRKIYPVMMSSWKTKSYDFCLGFFTLFAVTIMSQLPACIPLYWLTVSVTGLIQAQLLRHPAVKKLFGISRLPTDSRNPFRDIFLPRRV